MEVEINWLAVLLAGIANMVIGGIWYSKKAFGDDWAKIVKLKEEDLVKDAPKVIIGASLLALIAAYVMAHVTYLSYTVLGNSFLSSGISTAFWMWLGFGLTTLVTQGLFERRSARWHAIVSGNLLVAFLAMGWIIGAMGI